MRNDVAEVVVVYEDVRHLQVIRRYLELLPVGVRRIREVPPPSSCGEQHVRLQFASELDYYRDVSKRRSAALIGIVDADVVTVEERSRHFPMPTDEEVVVLLVPKRNVETWIVAFGFNQPVDENTDYKQSYQRRIDRKVVRATASKLWELARPGASVTALVPPSAATAIDRLRKFEMALRKQTR